MRSTDGAARTDRCPRCGTDAHERHPVPPEVMTRELVEDADGDRLIDWVCAGCIREILAEH